MFAPTLRTTTDSSLLQAARDWRVGSICQGCDSLALLAASLGCFGLAKAALQGPQAPA
jgi:hypothetical protein